MFLQHSQAILAVLSPLLKATSDDNNLSSPWELRVAALHCLEALSAPPPDRTPTDSEHLQTCLNIFFNQLNVDKHPDQNEANLCKV